MRSGAALLAATAVATALALGACGTTEAPSGFPSPDAPAVDDSGVVPAPGDDGSGPAPGPFGGDTDAAIPTGSAVGDAGCASAMVQAKRAPAYLLFVQDGSDSMNDQNKWAAVVPALESMFAKMQAAADPSIAAGLILFPDKGGPYPSSADVPVAYVSAAQASALNTRLGAGLALGTPTQAAIQGGYTELETFTPKAPLQPNGKKILVLITDGVPTDACANLLGVGSYTSNPCATLAAQELALPAPKGPIETFVIGVGQFPGIPGTFDPRFLGNLAKAGGTAPAGCNPDETSNQANLCYFEIDPSKATSAAQLQGEITAALDAIRGKVASCAFAIQSSGVGVFDKGKVNVTIDGQTILQDPANGWSYDDPNTPSQILLHGASCQKASSTITANVSIVLGCATQSVQ
jgi:hypothetical protein